MARSVGDRPQPGLAQAQPLRAHCFGSGRTVTLVATGRSGGEGRIYHVLEQPDLLAKLYHPERRSPERGAKLAAMLAEPPLDPAAPTGRVAIAWPIELLVLPEAPDKIAGFLMVKADHMRPIHDFYTPKTRRQEIFGLTYKYLIRMGRNLAAAVAALHDRGYVIGDVNESNILAAKTALVTLVDTDSFQVSDRRSGRVYRCGVGKGDYTPPELQGANFQRVDRTLESDYFGLAVVLFQLLMEGTHPFDGTYTSGGDPPSKEKRIAQGWFPYGKARGPFRPKPIAPEFNRLHPALREGFGRAFEQRDPTHRPSGREWVTALETAEAELLICSANDRHLYWAGGGCPWCARTARFKGRDPFPSQAALQRGDHLQPVKPHRQKARVVVPATRGWAGLGRSTPAAAKLPTPNPGSFNARLYWLAPGYSSAANRVSWIGFLSCVLVVVAILVGRNWLDFSTPGLPALIPRYLSATPSAAERTIARQQFPTTQAQVQRLLGGLDRDLAQEFPSLSPSFRRDRLQRELTLVLGNGNLVYGQNLAAGKAIAPAPGVSGPVGGPVGGAIPGAIPGAGAGANLAEQDRWIDALYSFQASLRDAPQPLGYFDPEGRTWGELRRQTRDRLWVDLSRFAPPVVAPSPAPGLLFPDL